MIDCFKCKRIGLFLGGVLFGTAGVKVLASTDAKKFISTAWQPVYGLRTV